MLSDDTYRAKLDQTIASVRAWTGFVADVARVEIADQGQAWRIALLPRSVNTCPAELVLRQDRKYDLAVGGQIYKDRTLPSLDFVLPLLEAVAEGRVVARTFSSAATGLVHGIGIVITLANGARFEEQQPLIDLPPALEPRVEVSERHFLPYRRTGAAG